MRATIPCRPLAYSVQIRLESGENVVLPRRYQYDRDAWSAAQDLLDQFHGTLAARVVSHVSVVISE